MDLKDLSKIKVAVLGFGHEGQAVFSYLKKHNIEATVLEEKSNGKNFLDRVKDFDLVFRSPGIPRLHPKIIEAEKAGVIITSQTKWFFEHCPAVTVGVTGTKGKGTTCTLITEIIKANHQNVFLTGNIGKIAPLEFLDELKDTDIVVFELSSFQLQDLKVSPNIGVCLMVTSDHLNHHKDLAEYHVAKSAITGFQKLTDTAIFNEDYEASKAIGNLGLGEKLSISSKTKPEKGAFIQNNSIYIFGLTDQFEENFDFSERMLRGVHNLENIAAGVLVATKLGISSDIISKVSNEFTGLEHRLQFVGQINGVGYYNDSISTIPETAIAALESFSEPTHIILGGSDKGLNYEHLVKYLCKKPNIASVTLLGDVGKTLSALFYLHAETEKVPFIVSEVFTDFEKAIRYVKQKAQPGDVVLLSPATASFDMFKNYAERGTEFVRLVTQTDNE